MCAENETKRERHDVQMPVTKIPRISLELAGSKCTLGFGSYLPRSTNLFDISTLGLSCHNLFHLNRLGARKSRQHTRLAAVRPQIQTLHHVQDSRQNARRHHRRRGRLQYATIHSITWHRRWKLPPSLTLLDSNDSTQIKASGLPTAFPPLAITSSPMVSTTRTMSPTSRSRLSSASSK